MQPAGTAVGNNMLDELRTKIGDRMKTLESKLEMYEDRRGAEDWLD
jgi:hypothetical protein